MVIILGEWHRQDHTSSGVSAGYIGAASEITLVLQVWVRRFTLPWLFLQLGDMLMSRGFRRPSSSPDPRRCQMYACGYQVRVRRVRRYPKVWPNLGLDSSSYLH